MTKKDRMTLVEGLNRICADIAAIAGILQDPETPSRSRGSPEPDAEQLPKSTIKRYVYTYVKDGENIDVFSDTYKTLYDVSQQIESANTVAPLRFYVFSGLLIVTGTYVLIVALTRKKNRKQEE